MTAFKYTSLHSMWLLLGAAAVVFIIEWRTKK